MSLRLMGAMLERDLPGWLFSSGFGLLMPKRTGSEFASRSNSRSSLPYPRLRGIMLLLSLEEAMLERDLLGR